MISNYFALIRMHLTLLRTIRYNFNTISHDCALISVKEHSITVYVTEAWSSLLSEALIFVSGGFELREPLFTVLLLLFKFNALLLLFI